jgi:light-regulated signal transduction histidine kinase (bacteriophytochrome)
MSLCDQHFHELSRGSVLYEPDITLMDMPCKEHEHLMEWGVRSRLVAPMIVRGELIGALVVASINADSFSGRHQSIAREVANQLAIGIHQARLNEQAMQHSAELESKVEERTSQLQSANAELEAFSYSVSHDLQAPLRHIQAYGGMVLESLRGRIDDDTMGQLNQVLQSSERMRRLIEDLLKLSRVAQTDLLIAKVDLSYVANTVVSDLRRSDPSRSIEVSISDGLWALCDKPLAQIVLTNLIGNAWKFTAKNPKPQISVGQVDEVFFVQDNGVGFDMAHASRLFGAFQRLHSDRDFAGTGIGLATVQRIINRHGGRLWAEAEPGVGATFYFTFSPRRSNRIGNF